MRRCLMNGVMTVSMRSGLDGRMNHNFIFQVGRFSSAKRAGAVGRIRFTLIKALMSLPIIAKKIA